MAHRMASLPLRSAMPDAGQVLAALPFAVLVIDGDTAIGYANGAAEQFFGQSAAQLAETRLDWLLPTDSPILALIKQVQHQGLSMFEHGIAFDSPRTGARTVAVQVAPLGETGGPVVVSLHELSIATKLDRQMVHRNAARSVTGLAAMLAHEVKNPLSGIRGAAQLLEQGADGQDRELTRLICEESDRICALVDRIGVFADERSFDREAINVHEVLHHVRRLAEAGFARGVRFVENYDPSLPPVPGSREALVQVFLNLVKNAAEAAPRPGGEIVLSTAFHHGVHLTLPGAAARVPLPIVVGVQDNGDGIPEDLRSHLFDPFVTTKIDGTGLGLALVARIVGEHGGIIELDGEPRRTCFRVMLPMLPDPGLPDNGAEEGGG